MNIRATGSIIYVISQCSRSSQQCEGKESLSLNLIIIKGGRFVEAPAFLSFSGGLYAYRLHRYLWCAKPFRIVGTTLPRPRQHPAKAVARRCQGRGTEREVIILLSDKIELPQNPIGLWGGFLFLLSIRNYFSISSNSISNTRAEKGLMS